MPKYMIQRTFSVTEDQMPMIGRRSRQIIEDEFPDVTWIHSHIAVDANGLVRSFCLYEASSPDAIQRHAEKLGYHIVDGIHEVAGDVTPEDFPPIDETA